MFFSHMTSYGCRGPLRDRSVSCWYHSSVPLSYSQLRLYQTCPRQYAYVVRKKLYKSMSEGESFGASVHNALKKWGEMEMAAGGSMQAGSGRLEALRHGSGQAGSTGQLMMFENDQKASSLPLPASSLRDLWHSSFITEGYETRMEADFGRRRVEALMERFYEWWQREPREVLGVEQAFSVAIDGEKVTGGMDRSEKCKMQNAECRMRVIDFKTGEPKSQDEVDADLQMSIYALAVQELYGELPLELLFLHLGEEGVTEVATSRNESQLNDARTQILAVRDRIAEGDFRPMPGLEVCRRCPFTRVCDVS